MDTLIIILSDISKLWPFWIVGVKNNFKFMQPVMWLLQSDWTSQTWPQYNDNGLLDYSQLPQGNILFIDMFLAQSQLWYPDQRA